MKKVKITLGRKSDSSFEFKNVTEIPSRHYQTVHLGYDVPNCTFSNKIVTYFVTLAPKVRKLTVDHFCELSAENGRLLDEIDLSQLKVLELELVCKEMASKLLSGCNSLHTLYLFEMSPESEASIPFLRSALERNNGLLNLKLGREYCNAAFIEDFSANVRFQLKSLAITKTADLTSAVVEQNFLKFLETQSQSLELLDLFHLSAKGIEFVFNSMPALKSLNLWSFTRLEDMQLNPNQNIEALRIPIHQATEYCAQLLRCSPNVKRVMLYIVTHNELEIINRHCRALESLVCHDSYSVKADDPIWASIRPFRVERFNDFGFV